MDIIGFDAQINAPKAIRRFVNKITPRPVAMQRIVTKTTARPVARPVAARPVAARPVAMRPIARPSLMRPVATRPVASRPSGVRPNVKPSKPVTKYAPAQVPFTNSTSNFQQSKPMAIVKPSGKVIRVQNKAIPVSTLTQTTNPNTVMNVSAVQRTFMPVDLPYQTPTPNSQIVRLTNTPYGYAVNVDMIEPAVDSGAGNYYGK